MNFTTTKIVFLNVNCDDVKDFAMELSFVGAKLINFYDIISFLFNQLKIKQYKLNKQIQAYTVT